MFLLLYPNLGLETELVNSKFCPHDLCENKKRLLNILWLLGANAGFLSINN